MVDELNLHPLKNPCPYDGHTKRQEAKELLRSLQGFNAEAYDHLAAACVLPMPNFGLPMRQNGAGR